MKNQFSIKLLTTCILLAVTNANAVSLVLPEEETVLTFDEKPIAISNQSVKPSVAPSILKSVELPLQIDTNATKNTSNQDFEAEYRQKLKQAEEIENSAKAQSALAKKIKLDATNLAKQKEDEKRKAAVEAARIARQNAENERKAKIEAERQELAQAELERQEKLKAEKLAKVKAELERQEKLKAEKLAKEKAELEHQEKLKAEKLAKDKAELELREKLQAEKLVKEQAEVVRMNALAKKLEAENTIKAKEAADKERKQKEAQEKIAAEQEIERQTKTNLIAKERAAAKAKTSADNQYKVSQQVQQASTIYNIDAEEMARKSVAEKLSKQASQNNMFDSSKNLPVSSQYSQGTTALQRATSSIVTGYAVPQNSPKVMALGFRATDTQVKTFDEKYQYNLSQLSPIPQEIGDIRLVPVAKLNGDSLILFANPQDKQRVEEYLMYHPHYAKVLSNFVKRAMTLNNGHTASLSVKDAIINELSFKISGISIPSVMNISSATDSYLYITSRLNDADQVKFWNWVNVVRTGSVVDVPSWIRLVDVMYSSN